MQNLLPIIALRPTLVIHLCSNSERFLQTARDLESAVKEAGISCDFQFKMLPSESPQMSDCKHAIKQLLSVFPDAVVNVSGGTKPMFLGTCLGAFEFDVPIIYCDSDLKQFTTLGKRYRGGTNHGNEPQRCRST